MKQSKIPHICTLLLCLFLLLSMSSTTALATDSKTEMTTGTPIHTWSATDYNFKDSFPLDIQPVIDHSTVEYISMPAGPKEPITVNLDKLKFGLRIALKNSADFESYEFYMYDAVADKILVHDIFDADEAVIIEEIAPDTHHKYFVQLHTGKKSVTYSGGCACGVDPGNEVFFSMNFAPVDVPPLNDGTSSEPPVGSDLSSVPDEPGNSSAPDESGNSSAPDESSPVSYDWVWAVAIGAVLLAVLYVFLRKRR